jgi:hypothetical protein
MNRRRRHRGPTRDRTTWRHDDRGQVGGIEVLPFGFLIFVAGTLLIVNAWAVVDARLAVSAAAREATRAYVEAPDGAAAAAAAERRATETLVAYGRGEPGRVHLRPAEVEGGEFGRCRRIRITVTYDVPALTLPFLGGFGHAITATATHSEIVDPFRNGLGEGSC